MEDSKEYLDKALEMIGSYSHLFLFGDDQEWLKNNFKISCIKLALEYFLKDNISEQKISKKLRFSYILFSHIYNYVCGYCF